MRLFSSCLLLLKLFTCSESFAQSIIPDTSFNHTGYYVTDNTTASQGIAVLSDGDGKYLVKSGHGGYFRFTSTGILDTSFNGIGTPWGQVMISSVDRFYHKIYKDARNRIISPYSSGEIRFLATKPNGRTDSSFGINGILSVPQTVNFTQSNYLTSFITFPDSSIVLASNVKMIKLTKQYIIDSSFGTNGIVTAPAGMNFPYNNCAVAEEVTGKYYILVENRYAEPPPSKSYYRIARFLPNGVVDPTFGINGFSSLSADTSLSFHVSGIQLKSDGKILTYGNYDFYSPFIYCHNTNGSVDSTFGIFGRLFSQSIGGGGIVGARIQKDDKILLINQPQQNIIRFTADGRKDTTFGIAGSYHPPYSQCGFSPALFLENDTTLMLTGDTAQFCNQSTNVTTSRFKLRFQPLVKGIKFSYCQGSAGSGKIINLPSISSDTIVSVKLDNLPLSLSGSGEFNFNSGTLGDHIINVTFEKSGNVWVENINFVTDTLVIPYISQSDTTVCNNIASFYVRANIPVYWTGNGLSNNSPAKSASNTAVFNPYNQVENQLIIAIKDNGACGLSSDTLLVKIANIWRGQINNQWEDSRNWSCSKVPDSIANVIINAGTIYSPTIRSNAICRSLTTNTGAILTVDPNYNLTVTH